MESSDAETLILQAVTSCSKLDAAATAPPSSPASSRHGDHDQTLQKTSADDQNNPPQPAKDADICTPGSPEFFLPANACIARDDPPINYSSPSDHTTSLWPNSIAASSTLLDCLSSFSPGASSSLHDAPIYGDPQALDPLCTPISQICRPVPHPEHVLHHRPAGLLHDASPLRHLQSSLFAPPSAYINSGVLYMMQGSDRPYFSRSGAFNPAGSIYDFSLHHNVCGASVLVDLPLSTRSAYPHNVDACGISIASGNEEEQLGWYNFLQQGQEDSADATEMLPDHCSRQVGHSLHAPLSCMPTMINVHEQLPVGDGGQNTRSPTAEVQVQLPGSHSTVEIIGNAYCCNGRIKPPIKRKSPDGEVEDCAWQAHAAHAHTGSPPLKMMRSPGALSSTTTSPGDGQGYNANPKYINNYNVIDRRAAGSYSAAANSCGNSTTSTLTSPQPQQYRPASTSSPSGSPNQTAARRPPTKASARQSVCNDPQSVAARHRRERISERLKTLQQLVPNGSKVDLVTMLEKAISYVKSLQLQVKVLSTDEYWPTPLSDKFSLNNMAAVATLATSTYS